MRNGWPSRKSRSTRVEAERDAFVLSGETISMVDAPEGRQARAAFEDRNSDPAEGDRSERRNHPDARGLLPRVPQSSRTRELGRCDANPLGERRAQRDQGISSRRSSMDPGHSASKWRGAGCAISLIARSASGSTSALRESAWTDPPSDDRGARPQAASSRSPADLRDRSRRLAPRSSDRETALFRPAGLRPGLGRVASWPRLLRRSGHGSPRLRNAAPCSKRDRGMVPSLRRRQKPPG